MSRPGAAAVTVLQHEPHEHAGVAGAVMAARGNPVRTVRLWAGERCPSGPTGLGALVSLGGDMDTDEKDRYPFLADEAALLRRCVEAGTPVLGLCLGAQLLAEVTGGQVAHGAPELGYPFVEPTAAGRADPVVAALGAGARVFSGHRDYITAGPGASVLARSAAAPVHAFRCGTALGLQFHPEFDAAAVAGYVAVPSVRAYLRAGGCDPGALLAEARRRDAEHRALGAALVGRWLDEVEAVHSGPAGGTDRGARHR